MREVAISYGQNMLDICIQEYGSVEALWQLAKDNNIRVDHTLVDGSVLLIDDTKVFKADVKKYFVDRGVKINTWNKSKILEAPSDLEAITCTYDTITVKCTSNSDEEYGFEWEASLLIDFSVIASNGTTGAGVTNFVFTELVSGVFYHVRVRAIGEISSSWSVPLLTSTAFNFIAALNADGENDSISINNISSLAFVTFIAVCCRIKFGRLAAAESASGVIWVFYQGPDNFNHMEMFSNEVDEEGNRLITFRWAGNNGAGGSVMSIGVAIPDETEEWHEIICQIVPTGNPKEYTWSIAVDLLLYSITFILPDDSLQSLFGTGRLFSNSNGDYNACVTMDQFDVIINQDVISDRVVIDNNGAGIDLYKLYDPSKHVVYYDFDEGVPSGSNAGISQLIDRSGNNRTGTLNNFAKTGSISNWISSN